MSLNTVQQLEIFGPQRCETLTADQARAWCLQLARGHYENFSVLSAVVPKELRPDFAAVYAFCRWADDLGDEIGDRTRSLELLGWWRRELHQCFAGNPQHPVFMALESTVRRHDLPIEPFDDLIRAFEQDQTVDRYDTWNQLIDYCRLSANPVGRLVLMICGEQRSERIFHHSDAICTALQLTNHWQDIQRDMMERNRVYLPREMIKIDDFEDRLVRSAKQGFAVDHGFLDETRKLVRACIGRTWPLYEEGAALLEMIGPRTRPIVWLLAAGGQHVLRLIEMWNYETVLHRPVLHKVSRLRLVAQAWLTAKWAGGKAVRA